MDNVMYLVVMWAAACFVSPEVKHDLAERVIVHYNLIYKRDVSRLSRFFRFRFLRRDKFFLCMSRNFMAGFIKGRER